MSQVNVSLFDGTETTRFPSFGDFTRWPALVPNQLILLLISYVGESVARQIWRFAAKNGQIDSIPEI